MPSFFLRSRSSVALGISVVALAVAAGAPSYAADMATGIAAAVDGNNVERNSLPGDRIAKGTLHGSSIAKRSIPGSRIQKRTIRGLNVAANTLNATHINESALGKVRIASEADNALNVGGIAANELVVGRTGTDDDCDPTSATTEICATAPFNLPHSGHVLLIANANWHADAAPARGHCTLRADGIEISGAESDIGVLVASTDATHNQQMSLSAVAPVTAAGVHEFSLACSEQEGNLHLVNTSVSAVLLGAN